MNTIPRNMVRLSNFRLKVDSHVFSYHTENAEDPETWKKMIADLMTKHSVEADFEKIINGLMAGMKVLQNKTMGRHLEDEWLFVLRQDFISPDSAVLHTGEDKTIACKHCGSQYEANSALPASSEEIPLAA